MVLTRIRYILAGIAALALAALLFLIGPSRISAPEPAANQASLLPSPSSTIPQVKIATVPPPPTSPFEERSRLIQYIGAGRNPIYNPSFETKTKSGRPDGWSTGRHGDNNAEFTYPVSDRNGMNAAQVSISSYKDGDAKWMFKDIPASAGHAYVFSDYYKSDADTVITAQFTSASGAVSWADIATLPPAPDWTRAAGAFYVPQDTVSLTVFHLLENAGTLTTDDYSLSPIPASFPQGIVSINFDDGWKSAYTAGFPILSAAHLPATFYIVTRYLGDGAYMTVAQVRALQAAGEEIGAHTRNHPRLTALTSDQMEQEIAGSRQDLKSIGIDSIATFAYPYGLHNLETDAIVRQAGFSAARLVEPGLDFPESDPYSLRAHTITNDTSVEKVEQWINEAIADRQWLILILHELDTKFLVGDSYAWTSDNFRQIVGYLTQRRVRVLTNAEAVKEYFMH